MGDRISFSFKNEDDESIAFFNHWGGIGVLRDVNEFMKLLKKKYPKNQYNPQTRREPEWIMPLFVGWYYKKYPDNEEVYLVPTQNDGDNSDNGHFIYDLVSDSWDHEPEEDE